MRSKSYRLLANRCFLTGLLLASTLGATPGKALLSRPARIGGSASAKVALDPTLSQAVVVATNSVRLKNQSVVESGDVVVHAAAGGDTLQPGYELTLDPRASTLAGSDLVANRIWIKNNATVAGDVFFNRLVNQGKILGAQTSPLALPVFASLPPFHAVLPPPVGPDVTVAAGGFAVLPAGDYGAVRVGNGGTLIFNGGTYNARSLTLGAGSKLLFAAAAEVRVAERLLTDANAVLGPEPGAAVTAHDLVLYVAGINGLDGGLQSTPLAADFGNSNQVALNVYVPHGTLSLGHATVAKGAFLARDVAVETQAHLVLDSYFFNRAPVALGDSATVDEGGTVSVLSSGALSVIANDSDPNGDPLTVNTTPVSGPSHGSLALAANGTFRYTHDGSETTGDSFVYQVCDNAPLPLCATATVTITVNPVNDPPVARDDSARVVRGGTVGVLLSGATSVLANDTDAENGVLTVTATPVTAPAFGTLTLHADGTFSYTQNGQETPDDSFVYQVCDNGAPVQCATATVTIAIAHQIRVEVVVFGLGSGRIVSTPAGIDCTGTCAAFFDGTTAIQLVAQPFGTSVFGGFSGDADCADGQLTPDGDKRCLARFNSSAASATLSLSFAGTGSGSVVSAPDGIRCPAACSAGFPVPTRVELTGQADPGSVFVGWNGDAGCAGGDVALFADTHCVAVFDLIPPPPPSYTLTLVFLGGGGGTVTSNPAGVLCETGCVVPLAQNTALTLFARPDSGSFGGWGGDCSGSGISTPLLLDANKTCTVVFDP